MKKYKKNLLVLILFLFLSTYTQAYAEMARVFQDCTIQGKKQNDDTGKNENNVTSSAYSANDSNYCNNICNTRFESQQQNYSLDLNPNLISECFNLCMDKIHSSDEIAYTASAKRAYPGQVTKTVTDQNTKATIDTIINYSIYQYEAPQGIGINSSTDMDVKPSSKYFNAELKNDSITTITLDGSSLNVIYACGHKVVTLEPMFPNMFQMSPDTVSGGDVEQSLMMDPNVTKTNKTLNNEHYAGTTDFDYDQYIKAFGRNPNDLDEMIKNLFCDGYAQDIALSGRAQSCSAYASRNNLDQSFCDGCSPPDACSIAGIKVSNSKQTADACLNGANGGINYKPECCSVPGKSIDPNIIKKYSGIKKINIDQSFFYKNAWASSKNSQSTEWTSDTLKYHPCLSTRSSQPSNDELTDTSKNIPKRNYSSQMTISVDNYPEKVGCYPQWHIYNTNYMDTGIAVSDGDFLSISWGGNMIVGNGLNIPFIDQSLAKALAVGDTSTFNKFSSSSVAQRLWQLPILSIMSTLEFDGLNAIVGESGQLPKKSANNPNPIDPNAIDGEICNKKTIYDLRVAKQEKWYGLTGNINRKSGTALNGDSNASCSDRNIQGDTYQYSGNLSGIGNNQPLKIRHPLDTTSSDEISTLYKNSIISGGYQVSIEWGGCPIGNGEGLEIALGNSDSKDEDLQWTDLSKQINSGYKLAPQDQESGLSDMGINTFFDSVKYNTIFMRVNTSGYNVPKTGDFNSNIPKGDYKVAIKTVKILETNAACDKYDFIKQIAQYIFAALIGEPSNIKNGQPFEGLVIKLSNILREKITDIVKVVLILYVSLSGLGFLMGTIQMTQKELINRFLNISFVIMILVDSSWNWLLQNYIRLFIVGSLNLASIFNDIIYKILYNETSANDLFDLFSACKIVLYLTEGNLIYRILALAFSSLAGLVIGLIIIFGVIISIKVIIEAMLMYISAILSQSLLILIAPFFMLLKLFKQTKQMFDNWLKQVILFSIVPIAIAIAVSLFLLLLQIGLDATMGFSYCTGCLFTLGKICLIPGFYTLGLNFLPEGVSGSFLMPNGIVSGALTFVFIVELGWAVVKSTFELMGKILSFKAENVGQENLGGLGGNLTGTALRGLEEGKAAASKYGGKAYQKLKGNKDTATRISDQKQLKGMKQKMDSIERNAEKEINKSSKKP